jgi:hypothetical protein
VNFSISSKNVESRIVTVNDSHFESSTLPLKAEGLPNSACFFARVSHSAQEPSVSPSLAVNSAGRVIDPRLEADVIEPLVTNTRSSSPTAISPGVPSRATCSRSTPLPLGPYLKSRSVTPTPVSKCTPCGFSQVTTGSTMESCWL